MDDPTAEKAKAGRAIRILYIVMGVGVFLPLVLFYLARRT